MSREPTYPRSMFVASGLAHQLRAALIPLAERTSAQLHQPVYLYMDYATPLEPLRAELQRIVQAAPEWDGRTASLVIVEATERTVKLRALVSARDAGKGFDLGCKVREGLLAFVARDYPHCLPQVRGLAAGGGAPPL